MCVHYCIPMKMVVLKIHVFAVIQCIIFIEMCENSEACSAWFKSKPAAKQNITSRKSNGNESPAINITSIYTTENSTKTMSTPIEKKIVLTDAHSSSEEVQSDITKILLSSGAIAVCAIGIIGSVLWSRRSGGTLKEYCNTRGCVGFGLVNSGQQSGKELVQPSHDIARMGVAEAGDSASCSGWLSVSAPELVYADIQHSSSNITPPVPRKNECEYAEIVGVIKG